MKHVEIYRAEGVLHEDQVEEVTINIRHPVPTKATATEQKAMYLSEGAALAEAIWLGCPGGTIDALIAALLARRASMLRVALGGQS